jgi:hypothetical protein
VSLDRLAQVHGHYFGSGFEKTVGRWPPFNVRRGGSVLGPGVHFFEVVDDRGWIKISADHFFGLALAIHFWGVPNLDQPIFFGPSLGYIMVHPIPSTWDADLNRGRTRIREDFLRYTSGENLVCCQGNTDSWGFLIKPPTFSTHSKN